MQDLIAKGVSFFESKRREHMAVTVEYRAVDGLISMEVRATIGGSSFETIDSSGQVIRMEVRDYMISVEDYPAIPRRGDRISETDQSGTVRVYEVSMPGGVVNPWKWADRSQRVRRIHTALVETR